MRRAVINPYMMAPPPDPLVEDFFDHGWDIARSTMWQEAGKLTPADDTGEDIHVIEPIVGTKDLIFGAGGTISTVNASDTLEFLNGGANWRNYKTASFGAVSHPWEQWVVIKNGSSGSGAYFQANIGGQFWQDNGATQTVGATTAAAFTGSTLSNATDYIVRIVIDGTSSRFFVDGTESSAGTEDTGSATTTAWGLGTGNDTTTFELYEMWISESVLSVGDASQVTALLKTEYGIS